MKKTLIAFALAAFAQAYAAQASATVIDFESLASTGDSSVDVGSSYTEKGFRFDDITTATNYGFSVWGSSSPFYTGSTALINNNDAGITKLTQVSGGAFSLTSIDLATMFPNFTPDGTSVTFTGTKTDNSIVTGTFSVVDGAVQTFLFTGFTNLTSVTWSNGATYHQFDNVNVSSNDVATVPLPGALALFAPGLGLIGFVGRRRAA